MTKQITPREARIERIVQRMERGEISEAEAQEQMVISDEKAEESR